MRTGCSSCPQSSGSGLGRSRYRVSTSPTEPGATVAAVTLGVVMCLYPSRRCILQVPIFLKAKEASMSTIDNGVNVQALLEARDVLAGAPEAAQFTWKASSRWENGVHSTTTIKNFFGLGEEQTHKSETVFDADHPEVFATPDQRITPSEALPVGLAGWLSAGAASVAQHRGIQLRSIESTVEGNHDIRGILGVDSDVRNGFNDVRVTFEIDADASKQEIEALVAQSQKRSAVFDAITNPTEVTVEVV